MKKKILLLIVTLIMCVSSICLAADNGSLLTAEEKASYKFMDALIGKLDYKDIQQDMTKDLAKKLDNKKFAEVKGIIKNQFGALSNTKLAVLEKHDVADRLFYISNGTKEKVVEIMLAYETKGKKPLLNELTMRALPVQEQQAVTNKK